MTDTEIERVIAETCAKHIIPLTPNDMAILARALVMAETRPQREPRDGSDWDHRTAGPTNFFEPRR